VGSSFTGRFWLMAIQGRRQRSTRTPVNAQSPPWTCVARLGRCRPPAGCCRPKTGSAHAHGRGSNRDDDPVQPTPSLSRYAVGVPQVAKDSPW